DDRLRRAAVRAAGPGVRRRALGAARGTPRPTGGAGAGDPRLPRRTQPYCAGVTGNGDQYIACWPPSIGMTVPLMNFESSDSRNATRAATSAGWPKRFMGLTDTNSLPTSSQFSPPI